VTRPEIALRPSRVGDAPTLARLYTEQRAFLAPFEPTRPDWFFTEDGQRTVLRRDGFDAGSTMIAPLANESTLRGVVVLAKSADAATPFE